MQGRRAQIRPAVGNLSTPFGPYTTFPLLGKNDKINFIIEIAEVLVIRVRQLCQIKQLKDRFSHQLPVRQCGVAQSFLLDSQCGGRILTPRWLYREKDG